ncbi:MAG: hypothetical protein ACI4E1_07545 [Lachnospira sp.]
MGTNGFNEFGIYVVNGDDFLNTVRINTGDSSMGVTGTISNTESKKEPEVDPEVKSTLTTRCVFENGVGVYKELYAKFYKDGFRTSEKELIPDIKNVIVHNNHAVIVEFADGTTEKAVLHPEDSFSVEQGISICITKKLVGGSSIYNKLIDRAVKVMINSDAERTKKKIEEEARKERKKKNDEKKARRKAAKREEYIETQKEAYIRALREVGVGG